MTCSINESNQIVCDSCEIGSPISAENYVCECPSNYFKNSSSECVAFTEDTITSMTVESLTSKNTSELINDALLIQTVKNETVR